jgi:hypothetical protein
MRKRFEANKTWSRYAAVIERIRFGASSPWGNLLRDVWLFSTLRPARPATLRIGYPDCAVQMCEIDGIDDARTRRIGGLFRGVNWG